MGNHRTKRDGDGKFPISIRWTFCFHGKIIELKVHVGDLPLPCLIPGVFFRGEFSG